jgi:hypothetical protein
MDLEHMRTQCQVIAALIDEIAVYGPDHYTYVDLDHSLGERLQHEIRALAEAAGM